MSLTFRISSHGEHQEKSLTEKAGVSIHQRPGHWDFYFRSSVAPRDVTEAVGVNGSPSQSFSTCEKENTFFSQLEILLTQQRFPDKSASKAMAYHSFGSVPCSCDGPRTSTQLSNTNVVEAQLHGCHSVHQKDGHSDLVLHFKLPPTDEDIQRLITGELENYDRGSDVAAKGGLEHSKPVPGLGTFYSPRDIKSTASMPTDESSSLDHIQISNVTSMSVDPAHLRAVWGNEVCLEKALVHSQNDASLKPSAKGDSILTNSRVRSNDQASAMVPLKDPRYEDISDDENSPQQDSSGPQDPQQPFDENLSLNNNSQMLGLCGLYGRAELIPENVSDDGESSDHSVIHLITTSDLKCEPSIGDQNAISNIVVKGKREIENSIVASNFSCPAAAPASGSIQVFDTVADFLESKAAVDNVQSPWGESCQSEKSSDTDDSCNYASGLEYNYLTESQHRSQRKTDLQNPVKCSPEKQNGSNGLNKSSWTLRLRDLMKGKTKRNKEKTSKPQNIVIVSDSESDSEHSHSGGAEWPRSRSSLQTVPGCSNALIQEQVKAGCATSCKVVLEDSIVISDSEETLDSMDESDEVPPDRRYSSCFSSRSEENDDAQIAHSLENPFLSSEVQDSMAEGEVPSPPSPGTENRGLLSKPEDLTGHTHINANRQKPSKDPGKERTPMTQLVSPKSMCSTHQPSSEKPKILQLYREPTNADKSNLISPLIPRLYVTSPSLPNKLLGHQSSAVQGQEFSKSPTEIRGDASKSETRITTKESKSKRFSREIPSHCAYNQYSENRSSTRSSSPSRETIVKPCSSTSTEHHFSSKLNSSHSRPGSLDRTYTRETTQNTPRKPSVLGPLKQAWKQSFFPTRRDKKYWAATENTSRPMSVGPKRKTRHKVSPNQRRPHERVVNRQKRSKQRRSSKDSDTILMKRSKMEALEWSKATNRSSAGNTRSYVGEGYKWSEKTRGSRSRKEFTCREESPHRLSQ